MISSPTTFSITLSPAWEQVLGGLDAALEKDAAVAAAREVVLRPVELLRLMAAEAPGALGDDVLGAERLRMLFYLAWPFGSRVEESRQLEPPAKAPLRARRGVTKVASPAAKASATTTPGLPARAPYEPGVLDHGALPILALAAVKVAPQHMAGLFLRTVHGLALAAAPAEALGRLVPKEPDGGALAVVLDALYSLDLVGSAQSSPLLRPFVADPVERGRWACLEQLLGDGEHASWLREEVDAKDNPASVHPWRWDGAWSHGIDSLTPHEGAPGESLVINGHFPELVGSGKPLTPSVPSTTRVIFASAEGAPLVAQVISLTPSGNGLDLAVVIPEGVQPGWVGFSDDALINASNEHRQSVKKLLPALLDGTPCLVGTSVAAWAIPLLELPDPTTPGARLSVPPRTGSNRFQGGAPVLLQSDLSPPTVAPGGALALEWASANADAVRLDPPGEVLAPSGTKTLQAPTAEGLAEYQLVPLAYRGSRTVEGTPAPLRSRVRAPLRIASISVTQGGRDAPFLPGQPLDVDVRLEPSTRLASGRLSLVPPGGLPDPIAQTTREPGRLGFVLPAEALSDGLILSVAVFEDEKQKQPADQQRKGPFAVRAARKATVVVVLPSVLELNPRPELNPPGIDPSAAAQRAPAGVPGLPAPGGLPPSTPGVAPQAAPRAEDAASTAAEPELPALTLDQAKAALEAAQRELALELEVRGLPWLDDALSVLIGPVREADDAHLPALLERMSRRALLTTGFESALWLMLLPEADGKPATAQQRPGFFRHAPSFGAQAVAVADVAGLRGLLAAVFPATAVPEPQPRSIPRLRLLGTISSELELELEALAQESRAAGAGAPLESNLVAVTLDAAGRVLTELPLRCFSKARTRQVELLLPVSSEVAAVEIRGEYHVYERLVRTQGAPALGDAALGGDQALSWSYSHSRGARAELMIALAQGDLVTPAIKLDAREESLPLPPRFRDAEAVVLQASDGWNVARQVLSQPIHNPNPVVLRRLTDGRFWADVPAGWTVSWKLDGKPLTDTRSLWLKAGVAGMLELEAGPLGQPPVTDARELLPGKPW